jgi:hypothetical protein
MFIIDYRPPSLIEVTPRCDSLLGDTSLVVTWMIADYVSGTDYSGAYVTIDGLPYYMGAGHLTNTGTFPTGDITLTGTFAEFGIMSFDTMRYASILMIHPTSVPRNDTFYCCQYPINGAPLPISHIRVMTV